MRRIPYLVLLAAALGCNDRSEVTTEPALGPAAQGSGAAYRVVMYSSTLGGRVNVATSINSRGRLAGFSDLGSEPTRHAVIWGRGGVVRDLGTLGGPNSLVQWPGQNDWGMIAGIAETNRHPFDVVEGESEIVAGHMVEYSGMAFAMFFLAEYANIILVSALAAVMFLGGWMAPISFKALGMQTPGWIESTIWFWNWFWLFGKTFVICTLFLWVRATFPRFRYDQIMRLGWKIFIPVTLVWLVVIGAWMQTPYNVFK